MNKKIVIVVGVLGSIASIVALAIVFFPQSPTSSQTVKAGGNVANVAGRDLIIVNPKPSPPERPKLPGPLPGEVEYTKLASPAMNRQFIGRSVAFRALFLAEWTLTQVYSTQGLSLDGLIFINHRNIDYISAETGLGSSDFAMPPFPLCVAAKEADHIYSFHRGDVVLVRGRVDHRASKIPTMPETVYVTASEIAILGRQ